MEAGEQSALLRSVIQEPVLLPSGAQLVSKLRGPPLAPLYLATGKRRKVDGGQGCEGQPWWGLCSIGFLLVGTQVHGQSPTVRLGPGVCASKRKGKGVGKHTALPWPHQNIQIA